MGIKKFLSGAVIVCSLGLFEGLSYSNSLNGGTYAIQTSTQRGVNYALNYIESLPKQSLSQEEIKDLLHMREEEKLARDVYLTLYKKWHLPVFRNIARSEQWHMDMVGTLLKKYNLPDPVEETGDRIGVFKDQHLQELYNQLVAKGEKSLIGALQVGATIEDLDIHDLEEALKRTDNRDIQIVYTNLMKGSRNHMRAFVGLLKRFGGSYTPQYISKEEFEKIISTPIERGFITTPGGWRVSSTQYRAVNNFPTVGNRAYPYPVRAKTNQILKGKVLKINQEAGIRWKRLLWWVMEIETPEGTYKVYLAPVFRYPQIDISEGDEVEVAVYTPPMWRRLGIENTFMACYVKDLTKGNEYIFRRVCPRF
ncbi:MAG: DUF2202 domain-containing protein [Aquificae bacterium]|nr:DUF2202 domain-containing protein [Aquificota bacterium]